MQRLGVDLVVFWFRFLKLSHCTVEGATVILAELRDSLYGQVLSEMLVIGKRCDELDQVEVRLVIRILDQMAKLFWIRHVLCHLRRTEKTA